MVTETRISKKRKKERKTKGKGHITMEGKELKKKRTEVILKR